MRKIIQSLGKTLLRPIFLLKNKIRVYTVDIKFMTNTYSPLILCSIYFDNTFGDLATVNLPSLF